MATHSKVVEFKKILLLVFSAVLCLFLGHCEKKDTVIPTTSSMVTKIDTMHVKAVPLQRAYCADGRYLVFRELWWPLDQYMPKPNSGKYIGVMDGNLTRDQGYKSQYGCTMVNVGDPAVIGQLKSYGYLQDSIIISLGPNGWQQVVDAAVSQGVNRFYIDEPIRNGYQGLVRTCVSYIASKGGTLTISESYFDDWNWYILGGRGNIGDMVDLALSCTPQPYVCCHTHFEKAGTQGHLYTVDPRDQWTYIKGRVPGLFKMVIIKSRQSEDDMNLLFGHANNIGINQVLLYPFWTDGVTYMGVSTAIHAGHTNGWNLERLSFWRQYWCCDDIYYEVPGCSLYKQYTDLAFKWE